MTDGATFWLLFWLAGPPLPAALVLLWRRRPIYAAMAMLAGFVVPILAFFIGAQLSPGPKMEPLEAAFHVAFITIIVTALVLLVTALLTPRRAPPPQRM